MYEISIHTSDRGTIRREAETIQEAEAIRLDWTRYTTTRAITVFEDGAEVEWLGYSDGHSDPVAG